MVPWRIAKDADDGAQQQELARFLRARRDQLQPEDVGLVRAGRRRVRGLRREEVAELAYVSTTWYTWLEQGRDVHASALALDSVCRALQLDEDERHYVRRLAGKPVGETDPQDAVTATNPTFQALLDDLLPSPAFVVTRSFDLLLWNAGFVALYGDPNDLLPHQRNVVWMSYMNDAYQQLLPDWPNTAKRGIAYLRAVAAEQPGDQRLRAIIADVSEASAEFRDTWELWEVSRSIPRAGEETIRDPRFGDMHLQILGMDLRAQPPVTMVIHYPADEQSRDRLREWVAGASSNAEARDTGKRADRYR